MLAKVLRIAAARLTWPVCLVIVCCLEVADEATITFWHYKMNKNLNMMWWWCISWFASFSIFIYARLTRSIATNTTKCPEYRWMYQLRKSLNNPKFKDQLLPISDYKRIVSLSVQVCQSVTVSGKKILHALRVRSYLKKTRKNRQIDKVHMQTFVLAVWWKLWMKIYKPYVVIFVIKFA